jgi:hypothetical protein
MIGTSALILILGFYSRRFIERLGIMAILGYGALASIVAVVWVVVFMRAVRLVWGLR